METKNEIIRDFRDYLTCFVGRFKNTPIHLIDISHHLTAVRKFEQKLKSNYQEQINKSSSLN